MNYDESTDIIGRAVYAADGKKVGKVIAQRGGELVVEKGWFYPKDFYIPGSQVARLEADAVVLRANSEVYLQGMDANGRWFESRRDAAPADGGRIEAGAMGSQEIKVPVAEEQLEARKTSRQQGEVVVRKDVVTEQKQITVPVRREEVHVERTPVSAPRDATPGEAHFQQEVVRVPVTEEQVEVVKRPVVKEEIRVTKRPYTEERQVADSVRKEQVEIEGEELTDKGPRREDQDVHQAGGPTFDDDDGLL